jgi:hypothetical protein
METPSNANVMPEQVRKIEKLEGMPRGLRLTRYGGGDDFRSAREVAQFEISPPLIPQDLKARICEIQKLDPNECNWESSFSISTPILGDDSGSSNFSKVNLYFHGFLFENEVLGGLPASQKNPLIGVFSPLVGFKEYVDSSLIGSVASAGIDSVRAADQHIHTVDPFAGGTAESYKALLIENGTSAEDADMIIMVESMDANQYYMGSDAARVYINMKIPVNQGWVVCIERAAEGNLVNVFVTYLLVVTDKSLLSQLQAKKLSDVIPFLSEKQEFADFYPIVAQLLNIK